MKNALIYTFSGTGNTMKISRLFAEEFEKNGVKTQIFSVASDMSSLPDPNAFDFVGFAYPIHAFNAPKIMLDLARKLQRAENKKIFILKSSGEPLKLNNISSLKMLSILKRKGYELLGEYHYAMPYNMIFRHSDAMAKRMWDTAKRLTPLDAKEIVEGKSHYLKRVPFGALIAFLFRIEHPAMRVNGRFFKIDQTKCLHCGKCAANCPEHNISMNSDGSFTFGSDCLMCARCSFLCPADAFNIVLLNGWRVNGAYDLNTPNASEDNRRYCKRAYADYFAAAEKRINKQV